MSVNETYDHTTNRSKRIIDSARCVVNDGHDWLEVTAYGETRRHFVCGHCDARGEAILAIPGS